MASVYDLMKIPANTVQVSRSPTGTLEFSGSNVGRDWQYTGETDWESQMGGAGQGGYLYNETFEDTMRRAYEQTHLDRIKESLGNEELDTAMTLQRQAAAALKAGAKEEQVAPVLRRAEQLQKIGENRLKLETSSKETRQQQASELLLGVNSQEDLDVAASRLADLGIVLPENYRTFNTQTKEALTNEAIKSKKGMELREQQLKLEKSANEMKKKQQEELLAQQAVEKSVAGSAERASTMITTIEDALTQISEPSVARAFRTGPLAYLTGSFGGLPAYNYKQLLEPLTSNEAFKQMQKMKDESATGATGLGPVQIKEFEALQRTLASLDTYQEEDQVRKNLNKIKTSYSRILTSLVDENKTDVLNKYGLLDEALTVYVNSGKTLPKGIVNNAVISGGKVYYKPANFTDEQWEAYKSDIGAQ